MKRPYATTRPRDHEDTATTAFVLGVAAYALLMICLFAFPDAVAALPDLLRNLR